MKSTRNTFLRSAGEIVFDAMVPVLFRERGERYQRLEACGLRIYPQRVQLARPALVTRMHPDRSRTRAVY